ncbi:hypothetical protein [Kocuria sp. cx-455]|uniref:hypothetical protein n=1 Tax=Kocuria sp. cx-455 TaxID=2771377 RepID=UPI003D765CE1
MATVVAEDAIGLIEAEVREQIRKSGLDPLHEVESTRRIVDAAVDDYDLRSARAGLPRVVDLASVRKNVLDLVAGYGPLQPYLDDPAVEEIWINGPAQIEYRFHGVRGFEMNPNQLPETELHHAHHRPRSAASPSR